MSVLGVSVVVPARNAATWLAECLESICSQHPREVIVVDGCSQDKTVDIARSFGARVISDEGSGLPAARMMGARNASSDIVALIDADVVLLPGSLARLLSEFEEGGFDGLQFGLASEGDGPGYWGSALAWHHNHSRVRTWFCVCSTLMRRDVLLNVGFDSSFRSGEDIDLRIRLDEAGYRTGVSQKTLARHRFAGSFDYARDQWLQDGAGLARTIRKHPGRAGWLVVLPLLATIRGVGLSLMQAPRFLPYWACFLIYNYRSMFGQLFRPGSAGLSLGGNAAWLAAARVAPMATGFLFWALAAFLLPPAQVGLASAVVSAALLTVQLGMMGVGPATLTLLPAQPDGGRRLIATGLATVAVSSLLVAGLLTVVTKALGPGVGEAWNDPAVVLIFLAAAVLATTAYQLDYVGVAQARADRALARSLVQGLMQLAVLTVCLAAGVRDLKVIVAAVAAGALASVLLGLLQLRWSKTSPDWRDGLRLGPASRLLKPGLPNHALMLSDRAPGYLLPLIIAAALGPAETAAWYITWMMAAAVFYVPQSAGFSLQTALAAPHAKRGLTGNALRLSLLLTLMAVVVLLLAGPTLLRVLGPQYESAWILLPVLAPALLLSCITQVYYGVCRAQGRLAEATAVAILAAVLVLVPATALAAGYGLASVAAAWSGAQLTAALISAWRLIALTRGSSPASPSEVPTAATSDPTGDEKL